LRDGAEVHAWHPGWALTAILRRPRR
jgi:hypothetical protein